ncbi:MAG: hypothetical protein R2716_12050 [Microthrixaceae bacterium]
MPDVKEDLDRRWNELGDFIREQRAIGELSLRRSCSRSHAPWRSRRRPCTSGRGYSTNPPMRSTLSGRSAATAGSPRTSGKTLIHIYESFLRENAAADPGGRAGGRR